MAKTATRELVTIVIALSIAAAIAWAGSQGDVTPLVVGLPIFAFCGAFAFLINWIAFVPSYLFQTERYFDLMGSVTYLLVVAIALSARDVPDPRATLIGVLIGVWALRLGTFLFTRILKDGSDGRFDRIKPNVVRLFQTWTLQGLWVLLTASCALVAIVDPIAQPLGWAAAIGTGLWITGFAIEAAADAQKRAFRKDASQEGRFITTGLWAWSRHPNYFGEILLWFGIAVIALPTLRGAQYATLISPLFVFVLLTRISGIPLLERRADKRWGDDPAYQQYKNSTPVLVPRPPRSA